MNEIVTTVMGNAVTDVTLKTLPSGNCVANFRIANNPKRFDKQSNTWQELDPNFLTINAWGLLAENIANSVFKGQPLIVNGKSSVFPFDVIVCVPDVPFIVIAAVPVGFTIVEDSVRLLVISCAVVPTVQVPENPVKSRL